MGVRPGHCYSAINKPAYTRLAVKVPRRNYLGGVPGIRIRQFELGNPGKDYDSRLYLINDEPIQIRDTAVESTRLMLNRYLVEKVGKDSFYAKIRIYPFHVLRENKAASGAGADRISSGMSHPFGRTIGRASRLRKGQPILHVNVNKKDIQTAKKALERLKARLPGSVSIKVTNEFTKAEYRPKRAKRDAMKAAAAAKKAEAAAEKAKKK